MLDIIRDDEGSGEERSEDGEMTPERVVMRLRVIDVDTRLADSVPYPRTPVTSTVA